MSENEDTDWNLVACHEAAHAVMRWRMYEPATQIELNENGGFCHGTGRAISPSSYLLIALAGFAYESGLGLPDACIRLDTSLHAGGDWDDARDTLRESPWLCMQMSDPDSFAGLDPSSPPRSGEVVFDDIETALGRWFFRARKVLEHDIDLIQEIGERLEISRRLSKNQVAALLRIHGRR